MLNGRAVQDWNTNDMIFDVPVLIEFLSGSTLWCPVPSSSPARRTAWAWRQSPPRWLKAGDAVTIEFGKIGKLTNPVANAA